MFAQTVINELSLNGNIVKLEQEASLAPEPSIKARKKTLGKRKFDPKESQSEQDNNFSPPKYKHDA